MLCKIFFLILTICVQKSIHNQLLEMICSEPKKVIDFTIRCQISLLTDSIDPTIQINFEKNETILLNKTIENILVNEENEPIENGKFLLLNSEIKGNCSLEGFEIFGIQSGLVEISLVSFDDCNSSCSNFFLENNLDSYPSYFEKHIWKLNITQGIGYYFIDSVIAERGDLLVLNQSFDGKIAVNSSHLISDYFIYDNKSSILISKLNFMRELQFSIKPLVTGFKFLKFFFEKSFDSFGTHLITAKFENLTLDKIITFNKIIKSDILFKNYSFLQIQGLMLTISQHNLTNYKFYINKSNSSMVYRLKSELSYSTGLIFGIPESIEYGRMDYLLTSSEFIDEFKIIGFELNAWTKGYIYLSVLKFSQCGSNTSCRTYFDSSYYYETFNELQTWKISVDQGNNIIRLPYGYKVKKGYVLLLKQNSTGRINTDISTNFFEDYIIDFFSSKYFLNKLDMNRKLRFCVNPIIDHLVYLSFLDFLVNFANDLTYQAEFKIYNYSTVKNFSFDSKIENLDIYCGDTGNNVDFTIHCTVITATNDIEDIIKSKFDIDENSTIKSVSGSLISHFGSYDSSKKMKEITRNKISGIILLSSTEAKFDTNLIGLELFAAISGSVSFRIIKYDNCIEDSCFSKVFRDSPIYNQQSIINDQSFTLVSGYNRIFFPPLFIKKGYMLCVNDSERVLAVNTTNDSTIMSDYQIISLVSQKLNLTENWRLLVNLIIDKKYFLNYFSFRKQYPSFYNQSSVIQSIEAKILNKTLIRQFELTYDSWYDLVCLENNFNMQVNCNLYIKSRSKLDSYQVDYGNNQVEYFTFENKTKNYVGLEIPNQESFGSTWSANYLLFNTEFINDTWIYGFEYFASVGGTVKFSIYASNVCETNSRCGEQLLANPISAISFQANFWVTTVIKGRNRFYLTRPYLAKKGNMVLLESNGYTARFFYDASQNKFYDDYVLNGTSNYLHKIEIGKKSSIFINVLIEPKLYSDVIYLTVNYSFIGNFNISVQKQNSFDTRIIIKKITITNNHSIDFICNDNNRTINSTINCIIVASSFSKFDQIIASNGNSYSLENSELVNYVGMNVPFLIENPVKFQAGGYYVLPLTEFKFDTTLIGFELYSLSPNVNNLYTYIVNHNSCGENISCLNWIHETELNYHASFHHLQTFQISTGYNKHFLTNQIKVKKGQMIGIYLTFPIAVDTMNNLLNSDYRWSTRAIRLNYRFNWRFFFNALIKDYFFINYFNFNQSFIFENSAIRQYQNLSAKYLTSNFSVTRTVNITKIQKIDFTCPNSNQTSKNTLSCIAEILTTDLTRILVDYGNCEFDLLSFKAELKDGFGVMVPKIVSSIESISINTGTIFILPNTEIKFDTVFVGFEYYSSVNGSFRVIFNRINECGNDKLSDNCGNFFQKTKTISPIISQRIFDINSQKLGHNLFWLTNFFQASQGLIISLNFNSVGRVALKNLNESYYEDYLYSNGNILKINSNKKLNFLFKVLTAQDFYYSKNVQFNKTFIFEGSYDLTILNKTKTFVVTSSKSIDIICKIIGDFTLNCNLYLYTENEKNSILIDYGDCQSPELLNTTGNLYLKHFGPIILNSSTNLITYSTMSYFLIMSNEFKFSANLLGFELFAYQNGTFNIAFARLSTCGDTITCSTYFSKNNKANLSFIFNYTLDVNEGYNKIFLPTPVKIPKGAVPFIGNTGKEILGFKNYESGISDLMYYTNGTITNIQSDGKKYQFLINSLIDAGYFYKKIKVIKTYPISANYNFSVKLANSSLFYKNVFEIKKDNSSGKEFTLIYKKNFEIEYDYKNDTCMANFTSKLIDDASQVCNLSLDCIILVEFPIEFRNMSDLAKIFRNKPFTIPGTITPKCSEAYSITFKWKMFKLNLNGSETEISIESNPSVDTLLLIIKENSLFFGIYRFELEANMTVDTGYIQNIKNLFTNSTKAYVQIMPTGMEIYTLENNLNFLKIGYNQSFEIEPSKFSLDYDQIAKFNELEFEFFCFIRNKNENFELLNLKNFTLNKSLFDFYQNSTPLNECFTDTNDFFIDSKQTMLKIIPGGLKFMSNQVYAFLTVLKYYGSIFYHLLKIEIFQAPRVPKLRLACKFSSLCIPSGKIVKIFSQNQLPIKSDCFDGCQESLDILYKFDVQFSHSGLTDSWQSLDSVDKDNFLFGQNTHELVISEDLFYKYQNIFFWKVDLKIEALYTIGGEYIDVYSTIVLSIIKSPFNGTCDIQPDSGYALVTDFSIECFDWIDLEGGISNYFFFAMLNSTNVPLGTNQSGKIKAKLPEGSKESNYYLKIMVQIVNELEAVTLFEIPKQITVTQKPGFVSEFKDQILDPSASDNIKNTYFKSNPIETSKNLISLAFMIYSPSEQGLNLTNITESRNSSLSSDKNTQIKSIFIEMANDLPIDDLRNIETTSLVFSVLTENSDEVSADAASLAIGKNREMTDSLSMFKDKTSFGRLKSTSDKIIDSAASCLIALNQNNSNQTTNSSIEGLNIVSNIFNKLLNVSADHLGFNQESQVKTKNVNLKFIKSTTDTINKNINLENGQFKLPNLTNCENEKCNNDKILVQSFSMPKPVIGINGDALSLQDSSLVSLSFFDDNNQEVLMDNSDRYFEIRIKKNSSKISSSFKYVQTDKLESRIEKIIWLKFNVSNPKSSIHIQIKTDNDSKAILALLKFNSDPSFKDEIFDIFKIFCPDDLKEYDGSKFYQIFVNMSTTAKHWNDTQSGVMFRQLSNVEYNDYCLDQSVDKSVLPKNLNDQNFDFNMSAFSFRIFTAGCYYIDKKTGEWLTDGIEVIEEGTDFEYTNCRSNHLTEFAGGFLVLPPVIDFNFVFANSSFDKNPTIYLTVIITSCGYILLAIICLYFDKKDKEKAKIHLISSNNAEDNYFYEIIVCTGSRKNAGTKSNVFINLTGERDESTVRQLKSSDKDKKVSLFKRSAVDTFLMAVPKSLGKIYMCQIFHDNSGQNRASSSWYLKHIIVSDLQTKDRFIFICENWLAVDEKDGDIDRRIQVCGDKQLKDLKYLLKRETKDKFSDEHLWFSIIARPTLSTFTRTDRLTCGFVILYMTMLTNILYYEVDTSKKTEGLKIGPFSFTPQQIGIGIMTSLISFPPSFLLIQLFRRSKSRIIRKEMFKKKIGEIQSIQSGKDCTKKDNTEIKKTEKDRKSKKKKKLEFPWWCKIIAYILSLIFTAVSLFFIITKGITFGDEKVSKWLGSFISGIFSSLLITQPIQVALTTTLIVLLFRKTENFTNFDDTDINLNSIDESEFDLDKKSFTYYKQIDRQKMQEIKIKFLREKKAKAILREVLVYSIFLIVLFFVSYTNKDLNSYVYQNQVQKMFDRNSLEKINRVEDIWNWTRRIFVPAFKTKEKSYMIDKTSFVIGKPMIRQLRIKNESCKVSLITDKIGIDLCYHDFGLFNQEKSKFDVNWTKVHSNTTLTDYSKSFDYKSSNELESYPFLGQYYSLYGGGYVYILELSDYSLEKMLTHLENLQKFSWIDAHTRGIFYEFQVYNPNINLFLYCTILLEIIPTGKIIKTIYFEPVILLEPSNSFTAFIIAINIVFIIFVIFFMIKEIRLIMKQKSEYLKNFWNYVEWTIFVFTWFSLSMYLYRLYARENLIEKIKSEKNKIIKLQLVSYWNTMMSICLGFLSFLGTIKFLKLLRFNQSIKQFMITMHMCCYDLINFSFLFLVLWSAFSQLKYLLMNQKSKNFSTIISTFESTFLMTLKKINQEIYSGEDSWFISIVSIFYFIVIVFSLLSIFIKIITDNFSIASKIMHEDEEGTVVIQYLKEKILRYLRKKTNQSKEMIKYNESYEEKFSRIIDEIELKFS